MFKSFTRTNSYHLYARISHQGCVRGSFRSFRTQSQFTTTTKRAISFTALALTGTSVLLLGSQWKRKHVIADETNNEDIPTNHNDELSVQVHDDFVTSAEPSNAEIRALFFKLLRPDIPFFLLAIGGSILTAFVALLIPSAAGKLIDQWSQGAKLSSMNEISLSELSISKIMELFAATAHGPVGRLMGLVVLASGLHFSSIAILYHGVERFTTRTKSHLYSSLLSQDVAFFDSKSTGSLVQVLTNDVGCVREALKNAIARGVPCIAQIAYGTYAMFKLSPTLTLLLGLSLPIGLLIGTLAGGRLRALSKKVAKRQGENASLANEKLSTIRTVRMFSAEEVEAEAYEKDLKEASHLTTTLGFAVGLFNAGTSLALNGALVFVLWYGGHLVQIGSISGGDLATFLYSTLRVTRSFQGISILSAQLQRGVSAGSNVMSLALRTPLIANSTGFRPLQADGVVEFRNVHFHYPQRKNVEVLSGINLKLRPGRVVALCGPSGGGKSTIAALLARLYDVDSGEVLFDQNNVRDLDPSWLRAQIGVVQQEPTLFCTSVRENIRYGRVEASDQEVEHAAKAALAHDFIVGFTEGYETQVGARGTQLSGGQKQRIAIARAILRNPSVLLLDESSSALGALDERELQQSLRNVIQNRAVLVIAHRLSTIKDADEILVVENGRVVERGTHTQLMKIPNSHYSSLVHTQTSQQ